LVRRLGEAGTITVGTALLALSLAIVALTSTLWVTLAAVVVFGYTLPLTFIALMTMLQRRTPQGLMGRVSAAVETIMGVPQALSLALGALLVTMLDYHIIFGIMATFTGAAVLYLLVALRGRLFRPDPPLAAPPVDASRLSSLSAPPSDTGVSALRWSGRAARPTDSLTA
jgi:MFS family permease